MWFLVLLINSLMGATFSIVKLILNNYTDPLFLVGYRMTLAGIILLVYQWCFNSSKLKIDLKQDWLNFIKVTIFHIYICYVFEFWSQKYLSPAKVAFLYNLTPFITALLSYIIFGQKQSFKKILGLIIGFFGFVPVLIAPCGGYFTCSFSWPELGLLVSIVSAAYAWMIVKNLIIRRKYSIILVNGFAMFWGGFLSLITSFIAGNYLNIAGLSRPWQPWPFTDFWKLTLLVLILILFSNVIYYNVYAWLLRYHTATFMAFSGLTIPLFSAFWEWLIFGTTVDILFWLSLIIVSLGLYLYYREELTNNLINL